MKNCGIDPVLISERRMGAVALGRVEDEAIEEIELRRIVGGMDEC